MSTKDIHNMREEIFNYFQRFLSGKTEKGDWLISLILCSGIFVLSWWFGGPVGGFTFILAVATIRNGKITQGLLKRSEEAFEQSRISFLTDIIDKTIEYGRTVPRQKKTAEQASYIVKKADIIKKINRERGSEFLEYMIDWSTGTLKKELKTHRENL